MKGKITAMRYLAITPALLLLLACSAPAQQPGSSPSGNDPAARIGDRTITMKEIEDRWRANNPSEQAQAIQALYEGRRSALESIIADMLIEQAAKAQGVPQQQYTNEQVTKRIKPVTEADVTAFFQQNQNQMQGRALSVMGPAIRRFLEEQERETARLALIADLRKAGPPLSVLFEPPRQTVAVGADDAVLGAANAPVTVIEFSDFQCPFCQRVAPTLKRLKQTYGDKIRIVWKDFPLTSIHPQAFKAAEAGNCAREQGKFWEYHDRLFANQQALQPDELKAHAAATGLDAEKFNACLDTAKYSDRIQEQIGVGSQLGINSTPALFVNGRPVTGAQPYEFVAGVIDEELQRAARR
jgi:protein-disulfide isomerase